MSAISDEMEFDKPLIGISSCLLGEKVRFDGGHKQHSFITSTLGQYFDFKPFCPEVAIGLGIPRPTIRLVNRDGKVECEGTKDPSMNVTEPLIAIAQEQSTWHKDLTGYIVKKDSPSCGMERVKLYKEHANGNYQPEKTGVGLYTQVLIKNYPHLPVEEEGRLGDPIIRENFITRVLVYFRWQKLTENHEGGIDLTQLMRFHGQLKYLLYSHDQNRSRELGRNLSQLSKKIPREEFEAFRDHYLAELMSILTIKATRKNHVNVLQHLQGYLKKFISSEDKQELQEVIQQYYDGYTPLIVPLTLFKHFFRQYPDEYIEDSIYLNPHPIELMLMNRI